MIDVNGIVKYLPNLAVARTGHGCRSYVDAEGNVNLIAVGGWTSSMHNTERHILGQASWTLLGATTSKAVWCHGIQVGFLFYFD